MVSVNEKPWREIAKTKGLDDFDIEVIELVTCLIVEDLTGELPSVCEEPIEEEGEEEWEGD